MQKKNDWGNTSCMPVLILIIAVLSVSLAFVLRETLPCKHSGADLKIGINKSVDYSEPPAALNSDIDTIFPKPTS